MPARLIRAAAAGGLALAGLAAAGAQDCPVDLTGQTSAVAFQHDPFGASDDVQDVEIRLSNPGDADRTVTVRIVAEDETPAPFALPGAPLELRLTSVDGAVQSSLNQQGSADFLAVAGEETPLDVDVELNALGMAGPGFYEAPLTVRITAVDGEPCLVERVLPVRVTVVSRALLTIGGATPTEESYGLKTIDFGTLETGETARVVVAVRANTDARLTMLSENQGRLAHQGGVEAFVPYTATLDGAPVDLAGVYERSIPRPADITGVAMDLEFMIGQVAGAPAGPYRDTIEIDVDGG